MFYLNFDLLKSEINSAFNDFSTDCFCLFHSNNYEKSFSVVFEY